ncbi:MAG: class I SAM-dependent methyltransferase [Acetobacteraceae bacterium]
MSVTAAVISHYARTDIAPRILAALAETAGPDTPVTPEALAPLDHFHSRGVAATAALCRLLDPQPDEAVLDIGCGIGGPARWIAARTGCRVTGVDLTPEFVAAAAALAAATGQSAALRFLEGSALALPLPDGTFERAYSQNVVMNIADKPAVYAEARRVLRPGGVLALSNLTAGPAGPPDYPLPWAAGPETSFLSTPEETRAALDAAGFEILAFHDVSDEIVAFNQALRGSGRPRLGMGVLVGEAIMERQRNSARGLAEGRLRAIEVLARRR